MELRVSSVSAQRQRKCAQTMERFEFNADSFSRRGGLYAPTLAERRVEVQAYLRAHSLMNHTEVAKRMPEHKHELVYAPPYLPGAQPIKPLWA